MAIVELTTAVASADLRVHRFALHERVSSPFVVQVLARSPIATIDLNAIVGQSATFRVHAGTVFTHGMGERTLQGIVRRAEQAHGLGLKADQAGLSTYHFELVPRLWLLSQRRDRRIFQHINIPDIVEHVLGQWSIDRSWKIDRARYPKLEFKIQHDESDLDFISRLLEESGIAFTLGDQGGKTTMIMNDRLQANAARSGGPIRYVDNPNQQSEKEFVTNVCLHRVVKPGAMAMRDYDFRKPAFSLFAEAPKAESPEDRYELHEYVPGGFLVETGKSEDTPVADDKGFARRDLDFGKGRVERSLDAVRVGIRKVTFDGNAFDVAPGSVVAIDAHPHPDLSSLQNLLVIETNLAGETNGEWSLRAASVFADAPYEPPRRTQKPIVHGLQSAVVVGPAGQEIHTDEFGRVRVQLDWDRLGKLNENSSCWMRVSQAWGGTGFGSMVIPRIGQEVFVAFEQGDPDHPVVFGRTYNAVQNVPYSLPLNKTRSTWKSDSSMGSDGFNEIMFEDLADKELVYQQAQKDRARLVKNDEFATVGHDREKLVKNDEDEQTLGHRKREVCKDVDMVTAQNKRERIKGFSDLTVNGDRRERIEGSQSLTVFGERHEDVEGRYALRANKQVHVASKNHVSEGGDDVTVAGPGGFVRIDGNGVTIVGTVVRINAGGSPKQGRGSKPLEPEAPNVVEPETPANDSV